MMSNLLAAVVVVLVSASFAAEWSGMEVALNPFQLARDGWMISFGILAFVFQHSFLQGR